MKLNHACGVAGLLGLMLLPAVGQEIAHPTAKGMMKVSEVQTLLKSAKTQAEHQKLADHFAAIAEWQERQASEYEGLAGGSSTGGHGRGHGEAQPGQAGAAPKIGGQYTDPAQVGQPGQPAQGVPSRQAERTPNDNQSMVGHGMGSSSADSFQTYAKHCREAAAEMRKLAAAHAKMTSSPN